MGVLDQPVEDDRSPERKWWEERAMSVIILTSWLPEAQPHAPAGMCFRRKRNMGAAHGLIIIRIFSKSNTKEKPSFISKSLINRVNWPIL